MLFEPHKHQYPPHPMDTHLFNRNETDWNEFHTKAKGILVTSLCATTIPTKTVAVYGDNDERTNKAMLLDSLKCYVKHITYERISFQ